MNLRGVLSTAIDAGTAGGAVAAIDGLGKVVLGQSWLIPVLQVAVSIIFIVKAVDRRMKKLNSSVNRATGMIEALEGRLAMLPCQRPRSTPALCTTEVEGGE